MKNENSKLKNQKAKTASSLVLTIFHLIMPKNLGNLPSCHPGVDSDSFINHP
jgi:hypothetical protein